jgi:hypothetical protein
MHTGPWIFMRKPEETSEREDKNLPPVTLIHDNETAKALGYQGGFVGGLHLLSLATGAIDATFGHTWYQGGTLGVRNRTPVFESELRVQWEEDSPKEGESRRLNYHLVNHEGEQSNHGWVALPKPGEKPAPPWERNPEKHKSIGTDALPEMKVGTSREPFEARVALKDAVTRLDAIKDRTWWFRYASPWGEPILTPFEVCFMLYQGVPQSPANPLRSPRLRISMDAGTDLVMYKPMFVGRTYIMKVRLVDKWQTEKSVFWVTEFSYENNKGEQTALMRAYTAHIIRNLAPVNP